MSYYKLIPELEAWDCHNGGEITPEEWASCMGSYSLAIAYASLIWPQFVEHDGMVFRERVTAEQAQQWMTQFNDKKGIEALVNHLHILDIQNPGDWQDVNETQVRFLDQTLRDAWAAKLAIDFPNKTFTVEFIEGSAFNLMAYQVLFYQSYGV